MGCHFSAHHCCDLLLISKWKPYFKNIHVCQALWKQDLWQFATKTHKGTGKPRQQNAFAVVVGRPGQAETEGEEGGDEAQAGFSHSLAQCDQSRAGWHPRGTKRGITKASQAHRGAAWELLGGTWDLPAWPAHSWSSLPGWTRAQGDGCEGGIGSPCPHATPAAPTAPSPLSQSHQQGTGKAGRGSAGGQPRELALVLPTQLRPKQDSGIKRKL